MERGELLILNKPQIASSAFVAGDAAIYGDVFIEEDCNIWFHSTIRGDLSPVRIGRGTNIQDNAVIHVDAGNPVVIGEGVTIGHSAVIHGCKIGDNSLIGMGAILLNGAVIGKNCMIGAGSLVTQNTIIPDNSLVVGNPARFKRKLKPSEIESIRTNALHYIESGKAYRQYFKNPGLNK